MSISNQDSSASAFRVATDELRVRGADPDTMRAVIEHASDADDDSIARLARVLAESGRVASSRPSSCDVASTGGPSSLTTLLSPLFLRELGYVVPKVGVPGRPAGAIDVLATIPGYRISFSNAEFSTKLDEAGFCHALAADDLAPLDGRLFALRKQLGAIAVAPLVIASLVSKKIAVGLEHVVLDVRVWAHGNFGKDRAEACERSARFCRVADIVGVRATCVVTDASRPYQSYIGRGESLLALHAALYGEPEPWLLDHIALCRCVAVGSKETPSRRYSFEALRTLFESHLRAQGSSAAAFLTRVDNVMTEATTELYSPNGGFLAPDMRAIRSILVDLQGRALGEGGGDYPDPAGIRLLVSPDMYVHRGDPIAIVRHGGRACVRNDAVLQRIAEALPVQSEPLPKPAPIEIITTAQSTT